MSSPRAAAGTLTRVLRPLGTVKRYVNVRRLSLAVVLLAGLFGALTYLQSRGGSGAGSVSVEPALLIESAVVDGAPNVAPEKGSLAPDFEVSGLDGRRFRLSDFRGSPVVVKFWATWCSSCLAEFPHLKELRERHQADGLRILAVNAGESYGAAKEYADFLDAPFDWALDPTLTVADGYRVVGFPVSVFVDRSGVIQALYIGPMDEKLMQEYARAAVDAAPAAEPTPKLRFITNLGRQNVLSVRSDPSVPGQLSFASQSFRCDPVYCADVLRSGLEDLPGVTAVQFRRDVEPPTLVIGFDPSTTTREQLVDGVRQVLEANPDPLYKGPIQVRYESP